MMKQHGTRRRVETQIISSQNNGTPIIFSSLRNAKTERKKEKKKKRVQQAKNIFHKLLTSCYLLLAMEDLSIATIYSNDSPLWRGT